MLPGGSGLHVGALSLPAEEWEVRGVQLVVDGVLEDVLDGRRPAGHLVGLLRHPLLLLDLPDLAAVALERMSELVK